MTPNKTPRVRNLSVTGLTALTGCITLVVITVALFIGLWLDSIIGQRGLCTIGLLVLSVPVSLFLMIRVALTLVGQIELPTPPSVRQRQNTSYEEKED